MAFGDLLKKVGSPFMEFQEDPQPVQPSKPVTPVATPVPQAPSVHLVTEVDPKVHDFFQQLLVSKNTPAYDYFEHSQTVENLKSTITDPATRVKTAVILAQTMGATKPFLTESAQGYLKHLEENHAEFTKNHEAKMAELVAKDANLAGYDKKIQELKEEIRKLEAAKFAEAEETSKKKQELLTVKSKFDLSYGVYTGKIKEDVNDINRFG